MVPPAQADEQAPRDVLDGPKVEREQQHHGDEVDDKVVAEQLAQDVRDDRRGPEEQVEKHRLGVPAEQQEKEEEEEEGKRKEQDMRLIDEDEET